MPVSLFSNFDGDVQDSWMPSIGAIALVDLMLVLLIIFLVTFGVLVAGVPVNLPGTLAQAQSNVGNFATTSVDKAGKLYLDGTYASDIQVLSSLMEGVASRVPQPALHIHADANAQYAYVGQVIDTAQGHGFTHVHLITGPAHK